MSFQTSDHVGDGKSTSEIIDLTQSDPLPSADSSQSIMTTSKIKRKSLYKTPSKATKVLSSKSLNNILSPTALSEPMSFKELRSILKRIIHNPDEYHEHENKIFIVPCKLHSQQSSNYMGFNVEKNTLYFLVVLKGFLIYQIDIVSDSMAHLVPVSPFLLHM